MTRDHRPALKKLTAILPKLVQASHVKKAHELEKIIKASFDFPSDLNALMGGMPPNHREEFIKQYKNYCFNSYEAGLRNGSMGTEMPYGLFQETFDGFMESVKDYIATVATQNDILSMVESHIKEAYKQGVAQAQEIAQESTSVENQMPQVEEIQVQASLESVSVTSSPINDLAKALLAKYESLRQDPKLVSCLIHYKTGQPIDVVAQEVKQVYSSDSPVSAADLALCSPEEVKEALTRQGLNYDNIMISQVNQNYVLAAVEEKYPTELEKYVKLLGTGIAEKVLRTYMGMKSTATADLEESTVNMCGPFDVEALKERLLQQVGSHNVDESLSEQVIVLDCLVSKMSEKSEQEVIAKICEALQLPALDPELGSYSLSEAMAGADMIADELTHAVGYPGNFVFVDADDDYCLAYVYPTETALQHSKLSQKVVTAAKKKSLGNDLPDGPQGTLSASAQKEIEALCKHSSLRQLTAKEIKEKAPTAFSYLKERMSEYQSNMITYGQLSDTLSMSIASLVRAVYGTDGIAFMSHCQSEAKASKNRKRK